MFVRIEQSEAEKLALVLDSVEADLVGLQHRVFRVRDKLQQKAGKPCGFQYMGPNERGVAQDDGAAELLVALKAAEDYLAFSLSPCEDGCDCIIHTVQAAIAKAENKAVTP